MVGSGLFVLSTNHQIARRSIAGKHVPPSVRLPTPSLWRIIEIKVGDDALIRLHKYKQRCEEGPSLVVAQIMRSTASLYFRLHPRPPPFFVSSRKIS